MKVGITFSTFDLFHAGHVKMLEEAKRNCDYLIVGLQTDPTLDLSYRMKTDNKQKNTPIQSYKERKIQIEGCRYVDEVVEYSTEDTLYELIKKINPDVRVLGSDWSGKEFTGHDLNIPIHWHNRDHDFSTSNLRKRVYEGELKKRNNKN